MCVHTFVHKVNPGTCPEAFRLNCLDKFSDMIFGSLVQSLGKSLLKFQEALKFCEGLKGGFFINANPKPKPFRVSHRRHH